MSNVASDPAERTVRSAGASVATEPRTELRHWPAQVAPAFPDAQPKARGRYRPIH